MLLGKSKKKINEKTIYANQSSDNDTLNKLLLELPFVMQCQVQCLVMNRMQNL